MRTAEDCGLGYRSVFRKERNAAVMDTGAFSGNSRMQRLWIQVRFSERAEGSGFWIRCRFPETIEGREVTDESNE